MLQGSVVVKEIDRKFDVYFINSNISNLRICKTYKKIITGGQSNKEANKFIRKKLAKGKELINAIEQRERTILNVTDCIIHRYQTVRCP